MMCRDKRNTGEFFEKHGIRVPKPIDKYHPTFPLFAKPYDGSLSTNLHYIKNAEELTTEILEEYSEIISGKASPQFAQLATEAILNNPYTLMITPYYKFGLISADPDDNKFVDCAIAANAQYIVTDDHHYNVLNTIEFPKVSVIKLDAIMEML
jgi:predicted nucleic acid-binding protein